MAVPAALDNMYYMNCDAGISFSLHNCRRFQLLAVRFPKAKGHTDKILQLFTDKISGFTAYMTVCVVLTSLPLQIASF